MSEHSHDKKISEQDILKVFDNTDEPFLTAAEIADALPVSRQAVNYRLTKMHEEGLVGKKKAGASAVGWWAEVAPRLAPDVAAELSDEGDERDDAVTQAEMKDRLGIDD
jgi:DNA-binding Lrp family transcriptional regulator